MPTIEQIRAARALLDWSQSDLADKADLSQTGIARIENGTNQPNSQTLNKIRTAFTSAGIEFLGTTGLRRNTGEIKTYKGPDGFRQFMDTIYETAKNEGGSFCLHNAKPANWVKWLGQDWFDMHSKRMAALANKIDFRITAEEGNTNFISSSFAEYRWFPAELFNDQSFYAYGNKLAFVSFSDNDVNVSVLDNRDFAEGFKILFDIAWNRVAMAPQAKKAAS